MANADEDTLRALRAASPALQEYWPDGESPRSWKGVTWSDDRVQELNLSTCPLEALPPEIGQLKALTKLDLSTCPLEALPPEIKQLQALTELTLSRCEHVAALPAEAGQLQALNTLRLDGCKKLLVLPPEIGQLPVLYTLDIRQCSQLTLAPGAKDGQPAPTIIAAYASLLIVEPRRGTPGQLHAFLLANPLAVPPFFRSILTNAVHADWLGEAVKATPSLAGLTDADGRRAIDVVVAHSACKQAMQATLLLVGRIDVDDGPLLH